MFSSIIEPGNNVVDGLGYGTCGYYGYRSDRCYEKNGKNGKNGKNHSHEAGMVRLTLNAGKAHGIRPADVVGTIAYHADIPGNTIGEISILDRHTLVDVPQQYISQTLAKASKYRIRKNAVTLELA